jgi:starvation-inducible DNA-binding protein
MDIITLSKIALANAYFTTFKAQSYHWNVVGKEFIQLHEFFGEIYTDSFEAVDVFAEQIRAMGQFAPRTFSELSLFNYVGSGSLDVITCEEMLADLLDTNMKSMETLNKLSDVLMEAKEHGFADYIAGRLNVHKKQNWMIRSLLEKSYD